jgi:hypothetical protein
MLLFSFLLFLFFWQFTFEALFNVSAVRARRRPNASETCGHDKGRADGGVSGQSE